MRSSRLLLPLAGALALAACSADNRPELLAPTTSSRDVQAASEGQFLVLAKGNGFSSDFASQVSTLGGTVESMHGAAGFAVVSGLTSDAAAQLSNSSSIADVQPDAEFSLDTPMAAGEADAAAVGDASDASVANPATAARYSWQWNMRDINAAAAWNAGKLGSASTTVSILDTGIDYNNPDLNGLVDLSRSTSFVASDNAVAARYFPSRNRITDFHGHGTNVAAQVSSKAVVHAGVTSKTTLIGVKVLSAAGNGSLSSVLNGVLWSADKGADVANMSLGGGFAKAANGRYVGLINRVFNYAFKKGMLIVVAAGNDAADLDHNGNVLSTYCAMPHVTCVSAVGPETATGNPDVSSYYTNFGRSAIDVAGPGGNASNVMSNWPYGVGNASFVWSYCAKDRLAGFTATGVPVLTACAAGNRVTGYIGTSQATPHVAGLAALLVSEKGHGQPQQIKHIIEASADQFGVSGNDPFYGHGRINVGKALGL